MQTNSNTNIDRIIAKIDNDFNPDNSDWIPRVAAWCIQAMQILDCLPTKKTKHKVNVIDKIAISPCHIDKGDFVVYDECGEKLKEATEASCVCASPSTGEEVLAGTSNTTEVVLNGEAKAPNVVVANSISGHVYEGYSAGSTCQTRNYIIVGDNKIELNYNAKYVVIECQDIVTTDSDVYGCPLPVIPNNGVLIEALGYYCIYKMLCRGYKHPVFNLQASQYGSNPYYMWTQLKDEAKRSVINDSVDVGDSSRLFRSGLFINTFDSRN